MFAPSRARRPFDHLHAAQQPQDNATVLLSQMSRDGLSIGSQNTSRTEDRSVSVRRRMSPLKGNSWSLTLLPWACRSSRGMSPSASHGELPPSPTPTAAGTAASAQRGISHPGSTTGPLGSGGSTSTSYNYHPNYYTPQSPLLGQVILTAGFSGEIRIFENLGWRGKGA